MVVIYLSVGCENYPPLQVRIETVEDFPEFMKSAANKIATSSQATPGVEGYVYAHQICHCQSV
jgi:hypothetical protein